MTSIDNMTTEEQVDNIISDYKFISTPLTKLHDLSQTMAEHIISNVPKGRYQVQAMINLEQAIMWASAGLQTPS